jgi:WD40 repeat protein
MIAADLMQIPISIPNAPFRGINPFRVVDESVFFGRKKERHALLRLITIYRAVLLYGESGAGKSSLLNAGFIPLARQDSFIVQRIRVQPFKDQEFLIESISLNPNGGPPYLKTILGTEEASCISASAFEGRLAEIDLTCRVILIFDQFEELVTLFEGASKQEVQSSIIRVLVRLIRDHSRRLKLIFSFREDYLARLMHHFVDCPDVTDQYLRLSSPPIEDLDDIILGPFRNNPGHFTSEINRDLAAKLKAEFCSRSQSGTLVLSEVQICCLKLWQSRNPEELFSRKGIQGLLEEYLSEALLKFHERLRQPAIALLSHLVTASGTRNVISKEDLINWTYEEETLDKELLDEALKGLEIDAKLVQRERRRELDFYEISSEFLVPWIKQQKDERLQEIERRKLKEAAEEKERELKQANLLADEQKKRAEEQIYANLRLQRLMAMLILLVLVAVATAGYAVKKKGDAKEAAELAESAQVDAEKQQREAQKQASAARAQSNRATKEAERAQAAERDLLAVNQALRTRNDDILTQKKRVEELARLADERARISEVRELVAESVENLNLYPDLSLLLAVHAAPLARLSGKHIVNEALDALNRAVNAPHAQLTLLGHSDGLVDVAYSGDGRYVATTSQDKTAKLWDVQTGEPVQTFMGHKDVVSSVALNNDGTYIATGSWDGTVKLWNSRTGMEEKTFPQMGHLEEGIFSVFFAKNETFLVALLGSGTIKIWNTELGQEEFSASSFPWYRESYLITEMTCTPELGAIAVAYNDNAIRVFFPNAPFTELVGHSDRISSLAFNRSATQLVSGSEDRTAIVWDIAKGSKLQTIRGHSNTVSRAKFSHDGDHLVTSSTDGSVKVWNVSTGQQVLELTGHSNAVNAVAWSPNGKQLVTAGWDKTAKIWHIPSTHSDQLYSIAFSKDGNRVATASLDGTAKVWNAKTGENLVTLSGHESSLEDIAFNPKTNDIATASDDGRVIVWDAASGRSIRTLVRNPDDRAFYQVFSVAYNADGSLLATGNGIGTIQIWDPITGIEQKRFQLERTAPVRRLSFSPDGNRLALAIADVAIVLDTRTGEMLLTLLDHKSLVLNVRYDGSGKRLATASMDGTAKLWDAHSGKLLWTLPHSHVVSSVTFGPDDSQIATGSWDRLVKIWDVESGKEVNRLGQSHRINALVFSNSGKTIGIAGEGMTMNLVNLDFEETVELAKSKLTRTFTLDECHKYLHLEQCPN